MNCSDCHKKIDYRSTKCRSCSKKGKNNPRFGKFPSNAFPKGFVPANKGIKGIFHHSEETKKKISKNNARMNPMKGKHVSLERRKQLLDILFSERVIKKRNAGLHMKPNKLEKYLDALLQENFPNEYRFTGNGTMMINRKFPDFTNVNGQKKVILLNGVFWHTKYPKREHLTREEIENLEKKPYEDFGYKVLHIWDDELAEITSGGRYIFSQEQGFVLGKINNFNRK